MRIGLNLEEITRWVLDCSDSWNASAIGSNVRGPTAGRSKNALSIELITANRLVSTTIWDSGEYDVIDMRADSTDDPAVFVGNLNTSADAERVLRSLVDDLAASSG